ncbi:hypothetical protein ASE28_17595 [Acidovorax sp. Root219]|nr:hypothetical protein ASE28_17595 [Acidovorax sp. Root219]
MWLMEYRISRIDILNCRQSPLCIRLTEYPHQIGLHEVLVVHGDAVDITGFKGPIVCGLYR